MMKLLATTISKPIFSKYAKHARWLLKIFCANTQVKKHLLLKNAVMMLFVNQVTLSGVM